MITIVIIMGLEWTWNGVSHYLLTITTRENERNHAYQHSIDKIVL